MWHVLDNIGVPMFSGNHDESLDPSIRRYYVNPPLPEIDAHKTPRTAKNSKEIVIESPARQTQESHSQQTSASGTTSSAAMTIQPKIPASELEGIDLPGKTDAQK